MAKAEGQPATKKAKTAAAAAASSSDNNTLSPQQAQQEQLCDELWTQFNKYLASIIIGGGGGGGGGDDEEDGDDGKAAAAGGGSDDGDTDELEELRTRIQQQAKVYPAILEPMTDLSSSKIQSRFDLIPILYSVASHILADVAIGQALCKDDDKGHGNKNKNNKNNKSDDDDNDDDAATIKALLTDAIKYFPQNAATWSMAANYGRIRHEKKQQQQNGVDSSSVQLIVARWYNHAVKCVDSVRPEALALLERFERKDKDGEEEEDDEDMDEDGDGKSSSDIKEWIELLLFNHALGVEWITTLAMVVDDDDDDEAKEIDLGSDDDEEKDKEEDEEEEKAVVKVEGQWTGSMIESTSRFMAAMQLSMAGDHDAALAHLTKFPLTHRLHANVWNNTGVAAAIKATSDNDDDDAGVVLYSRKKSGGGVLPEPLYERLCQVFAPNASYWTESSYSGRGYYSFFMDRSKDSSNNKKNVQPHANLIYEVIEDHLLPLVQKRLDENNNKAKKDKTTLSQQEEEIVGYEWWVHHRPVGANLGHNLHFDTDEAMLKEEQSVTHPVYSSVLYLTGGGGKDDEASAGGAGAGATVLLDQTPDSKKVAPKAWRNDPVDNSFLLFPGNLLHGVLPCNSSGNNKATNGKSSSTATDDVPKLEELLFTETATAKETTTTPPTTHHRLTFMVGFWTRRVPDKMKEQKLYGPCGALPPATAEHSWVSELQKGYDNKNDNNKGGKTPSESKQQQQTPLQAHAVPTVSPVWEEISGDKESLLEIPRAIDHRFFVDGAPECFRESLFEDLDDDDDDDDDDEEEDKNDDEACGEGFCAKKSKKEKSAAASGGGCCS